MVNGKFKTLQNDETIVLLCEPETLLIIFKLQAQNFLEPKNSNPRLTDQPGATKFVT